MKYLLFLILFLPIKSFASGFHYCTGQVIDIVTRASHEGTSVKIEGMNGFATLDFGDESYKELRDRQFSMLIAAQMAGKKVTLEFIDKNLTCADDHNNVPIRYVRIKQ